MRISASEAQRGSKPGWLEQKVQGVHGAEHMDVCIQNCLERATLAVLDGYRQPSGFFRDFQEQPVVIPVAEGGNAVGIQLLGVARPLDVFLFRVQPPANQWQAF